MSSEDTEWELLEKRINDAKIDPVAPTLRRATIKIDDELNNASSPKRRGRPKGVKNS